MSQSHVVLVKEGSRGSSAEPALGLWRGATKDGGIFRVGKRVAVVQWFEGDRQGVVCGRGGGVRKSAALEVRVWGRESDGSRRGTSANPELNRVEGAGRCSGLGCCFAAGCWLLGCWPLGLGAAGGAEVVWKGLKLRR